MSFSEDALKAKGYVWDGIQWRPKPKQKKDIVVNTPYNKYRANKITSAGVKYDSTREFRFKQMLDINKIPYEMKRSYILQEGFLYGEEKIRPIITIPDFTILKKDGRELAIVDIKGMILPDFKMKMKMLKHKFIKEKNMAIPVFMPRNKKEMNETISKLLTLLS